MRFVPHAAGLQRAPVKINNLERRFDAGRTNTRRNPLPSVLCFTGVPRLQENAPR
jgi:hypothetical protein